MDQAAVPVVAIAGGGGEVATTAGGVGDRRATAGVDVQVRRVFDVADVDVDRTARAAAADVADADGVPLIIAGVDLVDDHDAAVSADAGDAAVACAGKVAVIEAASALTVGGGQIAIAAGDIADGRAT